ncbi:zinc finger protein 676-like [Belonocnema kinseyi]|uniref:zinc finger protein 676-like n=1 Tax=Belonocnema kinseyi TaxID=2817044 RepID=UPI00143CFF34|nr:zinc finger protein 676-like [Belonocnema kinseyi]
MGHQCLKKESKKSTDRQDGGPYSSANTRISSNSNSSDRTLIKYEMDETLVIKDEIIQDPEAASGVRNEMFELKFCTVDIVEADILNVDKILRMQSKKTIPESKEKSEKKYKCEKCARTYAQQSLLTRHQKYVCYATVPQFICKFCNIRFIQKSIMTRHMDVVHHNPSSQLSKTQHKCDKCSQTYSCLNALNRHKYVEHKSIKPKFNCDFCGYIANQKAHLSSHITSRHSQISKLKYKCDKCLRSYTWLKDLQRHKRLQHAMVTPEFICDSCGYKANQKVHLAKHIHSLHFVAPKTKHYCDKCSRSYNWVGDLNRHKRLFHGTVKPKFVCNYCGLVMHKKSSLLKHIASLHAKALKTRHFCDKCSRSYNRLCDLTRHKSVNHAKVKSQFICDYCGLKTSMKSSLSRHMSARHDIHTFNYLLVNSLYNTQF